MNVDFISDIHIDSHVFVEGEVTDVLLGEIKPEQNNSMENFVQGILPEKIGDILLIAGDLGHKNVSNLLFLQKMVKIYGEERVIVVHGNHDLYLTGPNDRNRFFNDSFRRLDEIKLAAFQVGAQFLDGKLVDVFGVKIAGCPCFYDNTYAKESFGMSDGDILNLWRNRLSDSRFIIGPKNFDYLKYSKEQKRKLIAIFDRADIVLSHIPPIRNNFSAKYAGDPTSTFFQFDCDDILKTDDKKIWVYGHTHEQKYHRLRNIEFFCNPIGYRGENPPTKIKSFEI